MGLYLKSEPFLRDSILRMCRSGGPWGTLDLDHLHTSMTLSLPTHRAVIDNLMTFLIQSYSFGMVFMAVKLARNPVIHISLHACSLG